MEWRRSRIGPARKRRKKDDTNQAVFCVRGESKGMQGNPNPLSVSPLHLERPNRLRRKFLQSPMARIAFLLTIHAILLELQVKFETQNRIENVPYAMLFFVAVLGLVV
mmetsp:Transcript_4670/g.11332  ORF Transcript_4670/g.11332 Transcript_4670/m.11332 type:complete len:108 (+) Transcript_4670:710-1033(+)